MSELLLTTDERVRCCGLVAEGARLETTSGVWLVEAEPDDRLALRTCRLATRVLGVRFTAEGGTVRSAEVTAVWHRVPHTRPVPLGAAVALACSGVPAYVEVVGVR
jgi:hypothetical protein